ncbi:hypothetical protein FOZ63_008569 [Perkinsus olseni]|uniref:Uncharacterized protein n=1 Tax=Perkinsus olseni TaxID=32597 RepID=A0A7J6RU33_PEROL|nr:hypothetical protein FOZ63_008569 [Perkinsus olseni]
MDWCQSFGAGDAAYRVIIHFSEASLISFGDGQRYGLELESASLRRMNEVTLIIDRLSDGESPLSAIAWGTSLWGLCKVAQYRVSNPVYVSNMSGVLLLIDG